MLLQKKYLPLGIIIFSIAFSVLYQISGKDYVYREIYNYTIRNEYVRKKLYDIINLVYNDENGIKLIQNLDSSYDKLARPEPVRQEYINTLYQMMKDVHDTLEVTKIEYWADFGTLLGLVRNQGIIPWDDDLDIQISADNEKMFIEKAAPILRKLGYEVVRYKTWIKVHANSSMINLAYNELQPTCDIFIASNNGNLLYIDGWKQAIEVKDWKPLQLEQFGPIKIWRNNNPTHYLDSLYGKNWNKLAVRGSNHQYRDEDGSVLPFVMKKDDYKPALPNKELINNKRIIESIYKNIK